MKLIRMEEWYEIGVYRERPCKLPMPRSHAQLQVKQQNQSQAHPRILKVLLLRFA